MNQSLLLAPLLFLGSTGFAAEATPEAAHKATAERFFRGIYGCNPAVADELAAEGIVVSYPIFQVLFQQPALRGREAVKGFATRFCTKWSDPRITVNAAIAERDTVVLVWSFQARDTGAPQIGEPPTHPEHRWGGISVLRFDPAGKIVEEIGEESEPGPFGRLAAGGV